MQLVTSSSGIELPEDPKQVHARIPVVWKGIGRVGQGFIKPIRHVIEKKPFKRELAGTLADGHLCSGFNVVA